MRQPAKKTTKKTEKPKSETFPGKVRLSEVTHPHHTHIVYYPADGKRVFKWFNNRTEALDFAKGKSAEAGEVGGTFGSISETERAALAAWRQFVTDAETSPPDLLTVIQDFRREWLATRGSVTLSAAVDSYLASQEANEASDRHQQSLKSRLGRLTASMGAESVAAVTTAKFRKWLDGLTATRADKEGAKLTQVTRTNLSRTVRSFFEYAIENGLADKNPVPKPKRSKSRAVKIAAGKAPAVLLPPDVARFMAALQVTAPKLVPFWSLKFFAGVRDAEAARLDWSAINLTAGEIHIPAGVSKTGEPRTVTILPNLAEWLRPFACQSGQVATNEKARKVGFKRTIAKLNESDAKPFVFPSNSARHSFGTFHLYAFEDAGKTALQLGHKGNPAMLHEHYKNHSAAAHAQAFWQILPTTPTNVVSMDSTEPTEHAAPTLRQKKG